MSSLVLKDDLYGHTLVAAMAMFIVAAGLFAAATISRRRAVRLAGEAIFLAGSAAASFLWIYRWLAVGHLPVQSMFEILITMAMLIWPLSAFCRFALGGRLPVVDALIGAVLAFAPAFVNAPAFSSTPRNLPPSLQTWLFGPHVLTYMVSYVVAFMIAAHGAAILLTGGRGGAERRGELDRVGYRMSCFGFPLLTLGLVLGSIWAKAALGDYWDWDPKEMWSLASWFVFLGYFHFRRMFPGRLHRINGLWLIAAGGVVLLTLLQVILPKLGGAGGWHNYG